jgi:thiosulfate/3-mercaptopyruvate sulfurtransferase
MLRRHFLMLSLPFARLLGDEAAWPDSTLLAPEDLVQMLKSKLPPAIFCVTFPVLYRQKHIPHARFAGPTSKPQGISALRATAGALPRATEIVIYCGCCPMKQCPNIRPAYRALKQLGFEHVRVLDLPTNFHTDWVAKGYPVET